jgi:hypothetical protein
MHSDVTIQLLQRFVARKLVVFFQLFGHVGLHDNKAASAAARHATVV